MLDITKEPVIWNLCEDCRRPWPFPAGPQGRQYICHVCMEHEYAKRIRERKQIFDWLLGENGRFPDVPEDFMKRKFWWRRELMRRVDELESSEG